MFENNHLYISIIAVILSLSFITASVVYINNLFALETKDLLVKFVLMIFTSLVAVFIVDKIVAFHIELLSSEMDQTIFELIKTLTLMIFSYHFGTKQNKDK